MKPIRFMMEAAEELDAAIAWYEEQEIGLGREFRMEIEYLYELIQVFPGIGSHYQETDLRRVVARRFPYVLYYLDNPDEILVVAIAHGKRRPSYWKHRLRDP